MSEPVAGKKVVPDGSSQESEAPEAHALFSPRWVLVGRVFGVLCLVCVAGTYLLDGYVDYQMLLQSWILGWLYPHMATQHLVIDDEETRAARPRRMASVAIVLVLLFGSLFGWHLVGAEWFQTFSIHRAFSEAEAGRMKAAERWTWVGSWMHPRTNGLAPFSAGVLRIRLGSLARHEERHAQADKFFAAATESLRASYVAARGARRQQAGRLLAESLMFEGLLHPGRGERPGDLAILDEACELTKSNPLPAIHQAMLRARRGFLRQREGIAGAEEDLAAAKTLVKDLPGEDARALRSQLEKSGQ